MNSLFSDVPTKLSILLVDFIRKTIDNYENMVICKVVKVTLTKNTTLQRTEQLSLIEYNCIRN
jgi:hypothetical protein